MIIMKTCLKTLPNKTMMYFLSLEPSRSRQSDVGKSLSPRINFKYRRKLPKFCGLLIAAQTNGSFSFWTWRCLSYIHRRKYVWECSSSSLTEMPDSTILGVVPQKSICMAFRLSVSQCDGAFMNLQACTCHKHRVSALCHTLQAFLPRGDDLHQSLNQ